MIGFVLEFLMGAALLLAGGRLLVASAVDAARRLGVSPLVVGLTLVAWGTSAPELALNVASGLKGRGDLAIGNVVGANICNMALVLGVSALIRPLVVEERLIRVEIWLNMIVLCLLATFGTVGGFATWEAGLLLGIFGAYSTWTVMASLRRSRERARIAREMQEQGLPLHEAPARGWIAIGVGFAIGLALLGAGGSLASDGASGFALQMGIPPVIVGLTVVSIGTTLPEIVTSVLAVRKGQTDLAMGNAIGSCLFNAGAIFGLVGLMAPMPSGESLTIPLLYMGALAIALVPISRAFGKRVSRLEGAGLLASYGLFLAVSSWLAMQSA